MNKLGIKVYGSSVNFINNIHFSVNSINHTKNIYAEHRYRIINNNYYGYKIYKKINNE